MTDHAARVRKAMDAVLAFNGWYFDDAEARTKALVDAAEAKGRAEARAEAVRIVEGMERHEPCEEPVFGGTCASMRSTRTVRGTKVKDGDGEWLNRADTIAALQRQEET